MRCLNYCWFVAQRILPFSYFAILAEEEVTHIHIKQLTALQNKVEKLIIGSSRSVRMESRLKKEYGF